MNSYGVRPFRVFKRRPKFSLDADETSRLRAAGAPPEETITAEF